MCFKVETSRQLLNGTPAASEDPFKAWTVLLIVIVGSFKKSAVT
jgi:hypothetical protein